MKLSEMWRLSNTIYKEVSFQSIFSLRGGSALPQRRGRDVRQLVNNAKINTLISKLMTTFFIGVFGVIVFLPLTTAVSTSAPRELIVVGGFSAFLAVVLFLIIFMGLQVSTALVSSRVVDILSPLPLSNREISNVVFLCFIRIFDIPFAAAMVLSVTAYFLIGGSLLGGLVPLVSVGVTEIFALTLTIGSARFFYSRIAAGGSRSGWQTVLRFVFMLVWILPTFAAYLVVNFATTIVQSFASLAQSSPSVLHVLVLIYPFSYAFLISTAVWGNAKGVDYSILGLSIVASVMYIIIAYYCLRWVTRAMSKTGVGVTLTGLRKAAKDTFIKIQSPWLGIIRKDWRVASRVPSYASLFLLPAIETAILAVSFSSIREAGLDTALGILTGITMVTLLLPITLISIEGLASAYTRSLPTRKRTLISAKTLLSTVMYVVSLTILFVITSLSGGDYSLLLELGIMHALSVTTAIMFELTILTRKFWKEGFAAGNIYSSLVTYILILIPGYVVASLPMISTLVTFFLTGHLALPIFLVVALIEFAVMVTVVARE